MSVTFNRLVIKADAKQNTTFYVYHDLVLNPTLYDSFLGLHHGLGVRMPAPSQKQTNIIVRIHCPTCSRLGHEGQYLCLRDGNNE
jgi:predicted permease